MAPSGGTAAGWGPPTPCIKAEGYTVTRVQQGLDYANALLDEKDIAEDGSPSKRKITPITTKLLKLYSTACKETLTLIQSKEEGKGVRLTEVQRAQREVYDHEQSLQRNEFLRYIVTSEKRAILIVQPLVALRKYQLYSRYGDYLKLLVSELRVKAHQLGFDKDNKLSAAHRWTVISANVTEDMQMLGPLVTRLEDESVPKGTLVLTEADLKGKPTLRAIYNTAKVLELDWQQLIRAVQTYAKRNETVHSKLDEYLEELQFGSLAEVLCEDLADLPKLFEPEDADDECMFDMVIKRLIEHWYTTPAGKGKHRLWEPRDALYQLGVARRRAAGIVDPAEKERAREARLKHEEATRRKLMADSVRTSADEQLIKCLVVPPEDGTLPNPQDIGAIPPERGKHSKKRSSSVALSFEEARKVRTKRSKEFLEITRGWQEAHSQLESQAKEWITTAEKLRLRQQSFHVKWGVY